jgi:hypothetical protein
MQLPELMALGLAGGVINVTVTRSSIFKPLRKWLGVRSAFLRDLMRCPYCFGHWIGFLLSLVFGVRLFSTGIWLVDWFASALAVAWMSIVAGCIVFNAASAIPIGHSDD